jgi:ribonuclease E
MSDPAKFDDDWAELARELERDKPPSLPPSVETSHPTGTHSEVEHGEFLEQATERIDATPSEVEDVGDGDSDGDSEGELNGDTGSGDGPPGTGKKRKRRRRRRRKGGGQPGETGLDEDQDSEKTESSESENQEIGFGLEAETDNTDYSEEPMEEVANDLKESLDSDEDSGGELLRELIANWNVPSWNDVVSGLYRPDR